MAYYTGVANNLSELHGALVAMCVSNGWAWDAGTGVLSKAGLFSKQLYVYTDATVSAVRVHGKSALVEGFAPNPVCIATNASLPITFPVTYYGFVFTNPDEVYLVINYNIDFHQFVSFGQSDRWGLPGTGLWAAGTQNAFDYASGITTNSSGNTSASDKTTAGPFFSSSSYGAMRNYVLHAHLDNDEWGSDANNFRIGIQDVGTLLKQLPNGWNSEAVLLPIRCHKSRPEGFVSIAAELANARYTRNDYYQPRQIVNVGTERWMVFPFFKKDASARNGGTNVLHSGTWAWAIRYDGP